MYINEYTIQDFQHYLYKLEGFENIDVSSVQIAGEGNMNYTYRIESSDSKNIIVKQAPPYCAKFPDISAPQQRIEFEYRFYCELEGQMPKSIVLPVIYHFDSENYILIMQDLGPAKDFMSMYSGSVLSSQKLHDLVYALSIIHSTKAQAPIKNSDMRTLNHAHIFDIPLQTNNGLNLDDITEGLNKIAGHLKESELYVEKVRHLGQIYLQTKESLLHGDFYPGSWLNCSDKIAIIDPEFCYTGAKEFDLGVFIAHLLICQSDSKTIVDALDLYASLQSFDRKLTLQFAGCEIMRRLIGYAQLPLSLKLNDKKALLELSEGLVLTGKLLS